MREKRFLRVLFISFILGLGILLSLNFLSFEFSGYDQSLAMAQLNPNSPIRTSSFYFGYPTSYLGGLGTGLYPGLGIMPPISQQVSLTQMSPLTMSTLNSTYYQDIYKMYSNQASTFTNPFATYGATAMQYTDPFSQAAANTMSYANVFGVSLNQGQGFYRDPFYSTGGRYINYASPVGGFSSDQAYTMTPMGGTTHLGSSLTTPWTHIETNINTAAGIAGAGTSIQHAAYGLPTMFNMVGMNPAVAGTLALETYGSQTAAMDRMLSNTYAYTKEGMPYIPVASYYNAASVGGTNYFFPADISYQEAGTIGTGPYATGYSIVQEVPESLAGYVSTTLATTALTNPTFAGYVGAPVATSPYGGWTGGGTTLPVGWTGGATAASTGGSVATFGGLGAPAASMGGSAAVSGGWAATSGAVFGGWGGAPSGGSFGTVSGGWGGGGGAWGGGWGGGGSMAAGGVGGLGGGGSMGGGTYGGAPGAGFGGAPAG